MIENVMISKICQMEMLEIPTRTLSGRQRKMIAHVAAPSSGIPLFTACLIRYAEKEVSGCVVVVVAVSDGSSGPSVRLHLGGSIMPSASRSRRADFVCFC